MKTFFNFISHKLRILKAVAFVTYKEWSAYRTHSMVSIFIGPVYFFVQYCIWKALYGNSQTLNGMQFSSMMTYFGANALIGYLTMDFADWNLQMLVRTGKFLTFALRPIHHRFFAFSQKIGHRFLGLVFEFIPCYILFTLLFKVNLVPPEPLWAVLSIVLGFLMTFYVNYCIGLTAFFFVRAEGVRQVFQLMLTICSGGLLPLSFFPTVIQKLLFFLPFQYILYVPSMVCTGSYNLAGISMGLPQIVGIQAIAVILTALFSELLYRLSIKRFTGVGA